MPIHHSHNRFSKFSFLTQEAVADVVQPLTIQPTLDSFEEVLSKRAMKSIKEEEWLRKNLKRGPILPKYSEKKQERYSVASFSVH
jgi:hypothetical protein